ncbi:hypothetical protein B0T20DRAFT_89747 [Sordaria brevicollis]|uniref:CFEM domain-containing protein n=1 Tax=Sordaria brevicollis TaxID=83679 RepID=A0AAE0NWH9_SORBR|nr:hypothetical protein B0T20DRAFT_89747 [Sordaria brevicollis]
MKSATLLAFATSVAATFPFHNAPAFTCPQNTDNKCTDKQKTGFAFDDLSTGPFSQYKDFNFNGWTSGAGFGGRFGKRTGRGISGVCGSDKSKAPSFGGKDKFSLGSIHVTPEFDCDLEFHYDMPDGSTCKHRNKCTKGGTNVVNKQCGGATNVTIIYPPQPEKPKPSCSVIISTISFDCSTKQSTVPPKTKTSKTKTKTKGLSTTTDAATTSVPTVPAEITTSSAAPVASSSAPAESVPASETSTAPAEITSAPAESVPAESAPVESAPVESAPAESVPAETTSAPVTDVVSAPPVTSTIVTSFDSTSTIFVTEVQTITSCAPTITDCPANSVTTTVVTIATSTTICPVTETLTTVISATSSAAPVASTEGPSEIVISTSIGDIISAPAGSTSSAAAVESSAAVSSAVESSTGVVVPTSAVASSSAAAVDTTSSAAPVETAPVEPLPCPGVVPSCLNTFLFETGCTDNSDAECYCPNALFVKNVYECIYAHGESESIISEAITFFQGICAPYVITNPGIATGVPTYVTTTAAPTSVAPVVTTITVDITTVVPCTDEAGSTIPSSSTTVIVDTTMTVPQIHFTSTTDDVAIVPAPTGIPLVTETEEAPVATETEEAPVVSATATETGSVPVSTSAAAPVNSAPAVTNAPSVPIGTAPVGTGGIVRPTSSVISPPIVAGSGRVNAGLGLAVAAFLGALAL